MKFNNIKNVFFDLDHTLWDFDKNSALAFEVIFKEERLDISLSEFLEAYLPINENYWKLYRENQISKEHLRTGRLKDCFEILKYDISPVVIENLSNNYIRFLPTFNNLLEDTQEVLEYLHPKYNLHIITNGFQEIQQSKLINSRILTYFSTITTSEEAGVKKPHIKIFETAFNKSQALPETSVMVGDSYEADILGAINAGMSSVFFDYYRKKEKLKTPHIQTLKELKSFL